jgi:hypothetical protein
MIKAKAFRAFIRVYSLFRTERLSATIKLTIHKALISSVMTYACSAWEFAADACKTGFSAPLQDFQGAHWSTISIRLSTFRIYMIM